MVSIPVNCYEVSADPEVEEVITKCLEFIQKKGSVLIDKYPLNDYFAKGCVVLKHDHIAFAVMDEFLKSGYYCYTYTNMEGRYKEFSISKTPLNETYRLRRYHG